MPTLRCPSCSTETPRLLGAPSQYARVNYYRCQHCGHVWTTDKNDSNIVTHVTLLKAREPM